MAMPFISTFGRFCSPQLTFPISRDKFGELFGTMDGYRHALATLVTKFN
jgi:hypothetical protein